LKIAICDDDPACREQIVSIIKEYAALKHQEMDISVYERAENLMDNILRFGGYNIYILDIIMPGMSGIQLGIQLRQSDFDGKILYLTSSREYAIDAFRAKASDYLLKPLEKDKLFAALDDAINTIANRRERSLIVKTRENSMKLAFDSILYAELINRKITYHLMGGGTIEGSTIRTTFAEAIGELLQDSRFVLCGSVIAVNMYYITMVETDTLFFKNGTKLYIGKRAGREIRSAWTDFWMSGEGSK